MQVGRSVDFDLGSIGYFLEFVSLKRASKADLPPTMDAKGRGFITATDCFACSRSRCTCSADTTTISLVGRTSAFAGFKELASDRPERIRTDLIDVERCLATTLLMVTGSDVFRSAAAVCCTGEDSVEAFGREMLAPTRSPGTRSAELRMDRDLPRVAGGRIGPAIFVDLTEAFLFRSVPLMCGA